MAVARGARVQEYNAAMDKWFTLEDFLPLIEDINDHIRVHPDDQHLLYGPISRQIRSMGNDEFEDVAHTLQVNLNEFTELGLPRTTVIDVVTAGLSPAVWKSYGTLYDSPWEHRAWFLLFLAEFLMTDYGV